MWQPVSRERDAILTRGVSPIKEKKADPSPLISSPHPARVATWSSFPGWWWWFPWRLGACRREEGGDLVCGILFLQKSREYLPARNASNNDVIAIVAATPIIITPWFPMFHRKRKKKKENKEKKKENREKRKL